MRISNTINLAGCLCVMAACATTVRAQSPKLPVEASQLYWDGRIDQSIGVFRQALADEKSSESAPHILYGIGVMQEHEGRLAEAADAYERVVQEYPATRSALEASRKLVLIYRKLGAWEKAGTPVSTLELSEEPSIRLRKWPIP